MTIFCVSKVFCLKRAFVSSGPLSQVGLFVSTGFCLKWACSLKWVFVSSGFCLKGLLSQMGLHLAQAHPGVTNTEPTTAELRIDFGTTKCLDVDRLELA